MAKILKIIEAKNRVREKELREMDAESEVDDPLGDETRAQKKTKQLEKNDAFFAPVDDDVQMKPVKKIVQRNGYIVDEHGNILDSLINPI